MPNWKKIITSGSDAALNSLNVTSGVTGSLLGTASYATQALTASYASNLGGFDSAHFVDITSSQTIDGTKTILQPLALGQYGATNGKLFFYGVDTGNKISIEATGLGDLNFVDQTSSLLAILYQNGLGFELNTGSFRGNLTGTASFANTASIALSASYAPSTPTFPYTGSAIISGSLEVTGSINSTTGFTGSLLGTASYATNTDTLDGLDSTSFVRTSTAQTITGNKTFRDTTFFGTDSADGKITFVEQTAGLSASISIDSEANLNIQNAEDLILATIYQNGDGIELASGTFRGNLTGNADTATTASFASTLASGLNLTASNLLVTDTINTNNITAVSASFGYVETISGSAVIIGQEYIVLNTQSPAARFAGLQITDSGSNATASIVWDSFNNKFIYSNASGSMYNGGGFMAGPRNTGSLGDETFPTLNKVLRGQGGDHMYDSNITDDNTNVSISIPVIVTGSFTVITGSNVELQVTNTGVRLGNISTDAHTATGSFNVSGSFNVLGTSIFNRNSVGDVVQFAGGVRSLYIYSDNNGVSIGDGAAGAGENIGFSPGANQLTFNTGGSPKMTLNNTALTVTRNVVITGSATNSLLVRGSSSGSATNTLSIQNSNGSSSLSVRDDGALVIGRGLGVITSPADGTLTLAAQTANAYRLQLTANEYVYITSPLGIIMPSGQNIFGYGAFRFTSIGGSQNVTTGTFNQQLFADSFTPTTGTGIYNALNISNPISQSAAATGVSRGIFINPTLTRAQDYRAIETTNGRVIFAGSGSALPIFTVQGSQGELFSVTDSLSGSLFSVNDISGLPIMEVFSDNTILMGDYQDPMLLTTKKIAQTNSGSFVVYSIPTASYDGAFIDYTIKSGSNARAGTIMSTWAGSSIEFTEVDTMDIGSTTAVGLTMILSGSNAVLTGSSSTGTWTIRTIIRTI